jgi:hypothetical protein
MHWATWGLPDSINLRDSITASLKLIDLMDRIKLYNNIHMQSQCLLTDSDALNFIIILACYFYFFFSGSLIVKICSNGMVLDNLFGAKRVLPYRILSGREIFFFR